MTPNICPLETVHRRLDDAWDLLKELQDAYFDPERFRARLNDVIQALRNITFVLQSHSDAISSFDVWYEQWRAAMIADPILRWAHNARTQVVHRGDLETSSKARITVVDSYFRPRSRDLEVAPWITPELIARAVADKLNVSASEREITTVRVERRWVETTLPTHELLDALHYVFACIATVVEDAHLQIETAGHAKNMVVAFPSFREHSRESRTAYLRLSDLSFVFPTTIHGDTGVIDEAEIRSRYGDEIALTASDETLSGWALALFNSARTVMQRDGYHKLFAIIKGESEGRVVEIFARNKAEKFLLWEGIAEQIKELRATWIVVIGEVWQAQVPSEGAMTIIDVAEVPDKEEGLSLVAASKNGDYTELYARIIRDEHNAIVLGDTQDRSEHRSAELGFLAPVYEAWKQMT